MADFESYTFFFFFPFFLKEHERNKVFKGGRGTNWWRPSADIGCL